ncbi:MAG: phosphodiester glycosidase family protein [Agathobacter sp.]|nr:phosphodiester glycosidase family protein [Agathobacter sp.]
MKTNFKKILASVLTVCMLFGLIPPMTASAAETEFENSQLSVVTDKESTLANGVTQDLYTVYDKNGDQVKMFITTADMNVDSVEVFASYKDMDPTNYGMSKLTEQVASFNEKAAAGDEYYQGTVVAGINASYYNMTTGKPTGAFVMNGIDVTIESEGNKYGYFAVMKDGSVKIGKPGDYSSDKGNIQEAIEIHTMLIVDGKICSGLDAKTKYPRQTIGITADNKVIIMTADGNQAPNSIGLTVQEQAEVMLDLGCVWAGHLDGGGSATYGCKPEGSDKFVVTNSPSDGSERSVSNGFIIVSTDVPSYEFDRVSYTVENENITPGTSISVGTAGVSSTGHPADIPADITYVVENGTYADGVFTAGDKLGTATITAMYNGKKAGSVSVNVVLPDKIAFSSTEITVPYGKTVALEIAATLDVKNVKVKPEDFTFTLKDTTAGKLDGFNFTACEESVGAEGSDLTATLVLNNEITASTKITLGKGSEVVYDFEDGTAQNIVVNETAGTKYNYVWPEVEQKVVTSETGKVHSGEYALAADINYGNSLESGYMKTSLYATETRTFKNAVGIGVWIYIPDECVGLWARWTLRSVTGYNADGTPIWGSAYINSNTMDTGAGGTGVVSTFDEPGWHYLYADTSSYSEVGWAANGAMMQFYISDRDGSAYNYYASENSNIPGKFRFYFDDFTVDYSSAVDDREAPVFKNLTYATEGMADAVVLNEQTITTDKVTFGVTLSDYNKSNATGIDASTVKAYIDGVEVEKQYANGMVSVDATGLTNGRHTVKFAANDKIGNYGYIYGYINVASENSGSTVKLVPHDETLNHILLGSVYNMDLVATAIDEVQSVDVVVDLDNNSTWELDYMTVAEGFEATYTVEETENIATITITRVGKNTETGEAVLATLPVRIWELKTGYTYPNGTKAGQAAMTYQQFRNGKEFWRMSVIATVDKGVLTRVDDTVATFTGERLFCDTEMWGNYAAMSATTEGLAYYNAWNGGHLHTAEAIADLAPTCTEDGYTGRTFCEVCNSVVDWGTIIDATGHNYEVVDGVLRCTNDDCSELYNGVYTDGKLYVDGIAAEGWMENSYYVDGVALTGVQYADGYYYDFGDDGVSKGKYTGLVTIDGEYYFSKLGVLSGGWFQIGEDWYYFDEETLTTVDENTFTYEFGHQATYQFYENGKIVSGAWVELDLGTRYYYGPAYYKLTAKRGNAYWVTIDGNKYAFDGMGFRHEGMSFIVESNNPQQLMVFSDEGVYQEIYTGMYEGKYYENGYICPNKGLIEYEGDYYYIISGGKTYVGTLFVTEAKTNGLVEPKKYTFAEDGKMVIEPAKNGIVDGKYYVDDEVVTGAGMVKVDGDLYFVTMSGKVYVDGTLAIGEAKANGLVKPGKHTFGADGKMVIEPAKNGIVDGKYYVDDEVVTGAGMVKVDGDLYFVTMSGKVYTNGTLAIGEAKANGLVKPGKHTFGADGKMVIEPAKNGIVDGKYYVNDELVTGAGMVKVDGDLYFVTMSGKVYVDGTISVGEAKANGLVKPGKHTFGADGKMVIEPAKNGIVDGKYYVNDELVTGAGVVEVDGALYFINASGKVYVGSISIGEAKTNGLIDAGAYKTDASGKLIIE